LIGAYEIVGNDTLWNQVKEGAYKIKKRRKADGLYFETLAWKTTHWGLSEPPVLLNPTEGEMVFHQASMLGLGPKMVKEQDKDSSFGMKYEECFDSWYKTHLANPNPIDSPQTRADEPKEIIQPSPQADDPEMEKGREAVTASSWVGVA
jgi:hypothetical protein